MRARLAVLAAVAASLVLAAPAAAQNAGDPTQTSAQFLGGVPTLQDVVPTPGGRTAS